ncbi:STAS domain-containing protein [Amycolatopsis sp. CA-128772]|uniref:STAS domain-containing protein n=1 Tax=Amycolatopsis sp. CA-128772 TaxID=2073159 RepID=UPI000CD221B7|nr:STAS domain-containing protein [Amycolatopsis sp. CA-128772]
MRDDIATERPGGVLVVEVRGELDIDSVLRWTTVFEAAICELPGPHLLVLDLGLLEFLSVRGARGMLGAFARCRQRGIAGCLITPPGTDVERVVRLTGLAGEVPVFEHRLSAIAAYQPDAVRWLPR